MINRMLFGCCTYADFECNTCETIFVVCIDAYLVIRLTAYNTGFSYVDFRVRACSAQRSITHAQLFNACVLYK